MILEKQRRRMIPRVLGVVGLATKEETDTGLFFEVCQTLKRGIANGKLHGWDALRALHPSEVSGQEQLQGLTALLLVQLPRHQLLRLDEIARAVGVEVIIAINLHGFVLRVLYDQGDMTQPDSNKSTDDELESDRMKAYTVEPQSAQSIRRVMPSGVIEVYDDLAFTFEVGQHVIFSALRPVNANDASHAIAIEDAGAFEIIETRPSRSQLKIDRRGIPFTRIASEAGVVERVHLVGQSIESGDTRYSEEAKDREMTLTKVRKYYRPLREVMVWPHDKEGHASIWPLQQTDPQLWQTHAYLQGLAGFIQQYGFTPSPRNADGVRLFADQYLLDNQLVLGAPQSMPPILEPDLCEFLTQYVNIEHPVLVRALRRLVIAILCGEKSEFKPGQQQLLILFPLQDVLELGPVDLDDPEIDELLQCRLPPYMLQ